MILLGTIVNAAAILMGGLVGLFVKGGLPERFAQTVMQGVALCVLLIGVSGALEGMPHLMAVILYMVLGALLGEGLKIEEGLERFGKRVEEKFSKGDSQFTKGFVTSSLLFCVGAMAIMGSFESGLKGAHDILYSKSILDGIAALIFASTLGVGVLFSAASVLIYQGLLTLLSGALSAVLTEVVIVQMSAVGGLLIMALGLNMLLSSKLKVGNLLPAIFLPILANALHLI